MMIVSFRLSSVFVALALVIHSSLVSAADEAKPTGPKSPVSPEESLRWFDLDPGLRIELAAAEPEVVDPVTVRFDERGRMWVAEYRDYPNGPAAGGKPLSRIKLLEDKDDDGRYETAHVFADELSFCNGLQPWDGGVVATMAGRIAFLKDTDCDNKADVNETWYVGFAEENPQLRVNHPRFGLDNHIYVANGLKGGAVTNPRDPKAAPASLRGHDLKFDPRTGKYEAISGNGQFGLTFDDYGNRFVCSNRNPLMHVVLEDRYLARNPSLIVPAVMNDVADFGEKSHVYPLVQAWTTSIHHAGQYSAACGVEIYRGDALPKEYYGNAFICEPTGSLVHREVLTPTGATFTSKSPYENREFLASRDPWFRGVYLDGGPDGALYLCDMYRAVIEHPAFMPEELKNRPDMRFGDDRGRIYRIVPKDFVRPSKKPALDKATTAELIAALDHPNAWWRETAQRLLYQMEGAAAIEPLLAMITAGKTPQGRVHAMWALHGFNERATLAFRDTFGAPTPAGQRSYELMRKAFAAALEDKHPRVREQATLVTDFPALTEGSEYFPLVLLNARHDDARLRFQSALTLGDLKISDPSKAATVVTKLVETLADIVDRADDGPWTRTAVFTAPYHDTAMILPILMSRTKLTGPAESAKRRALLRQVALTVAPRLDHGLAQLREELKRQGTTEEGRELILAVAAGLGTRIAAVLDSEGMLPLRDEGLEAATDPKVAKEQRLDGLAVLAATATSKAAAADDEAILNLVRTDPDGEIRSKALACFASQSTPETVKTLLALLPKQSPAMRGQIFDALLSRKERITALLDAVERGELKPKELDQTRVARLSKLADPELRSRAEKLFASAMPADRTKALEAYRPVLALKADARRGQGVFKKNCATCHKVGGVGVDVGPSIADLRTKTPEQVLTDVLQPNKAIDNNFVSYTVVTEDGLQYVGILAAETPGSVTLKLPDGKQQSILKTAIDTLESNGVSLMPEGLERNIPPQDMADVISYVKNWRYLDGAIPDAPGSAKN
jgi:putative membrane-bound dehydrogenase-like protein